MIWFLCLSNQGFRWYTRQLSMDEDGDVADEFLDEIIPEGSVNNAKSPVGRFQVKYNTKRTALALRKHVIAVDGDIRHSLEHQGQLRWVWPSLLSPYESAGWAEAGAPMGEANDLGYPSLKWT